ncbi:MAG TPA: hypothetical protein VFP56_12920 [Candidatus Limnocylindrales bacterium]|nr:hypothetical protein [Candidatus Limnocylindrales bacterium]
MSRSTALQCGLHAPDIGNLCPPGTAPPSLSCPSRHSDAERGTDMLPLLLWILGVPGLIIILLLLLGVIHI